MNPLIEAAERAATDGWLLGVMTVFFFAVFLVYLVWAWLPSNRAHMDAMSRAPLDDDPNDNLKTKLRAGGLR